MAFRGRVNGGPTLFVGWVRVSNGFDWRLRMAFRLYAAILTCSDIGYVIYIIKVIHSIGRYLHKEPLPTQISMRFRIKLSSVGIL